MDPGLSQTDIPTTPKGYRDLLSWAQALGEVEVFGIEGTGSYGAGLARFLRSAGQVVIEVNRPKRQDRRRNGKSNPADAEAAARAVLSGDATAICQRSSISLAFEQDVQVIPYPCVHVIPYP